MTQDGVSEPAFRSGFVSLVGRPNVGKSTLVNQLVGAKVSIVSSRPQTTRTQVRGVRTTADSQIVLLDTPGIHKPRTLLGQRCNERSVATLGEVDVVCQLDRGECDRGSRRPLHRRPRRARADAEDPRRQQGRRRGTRRDRRAAGARVGRARRLRRVRPAVGADAARASTPWSTEILGRLPEGPHYYPDGVVSDQPETTLVAELLREQLLAIARDELPHSIAVTAEVLEDDVVDGTTTSRTTTGEPRSGRRSCATGRSSGSSATPRRASSSAKVGR